MKKGYKYMKPTFLRRLSQYPLVGYYWTAACQNHCHAAIIVMSKSK